MKRRRCFVRGGKVYMNIEAMTDLAMNLYSEFLRTKLANMVVPVHKMLNSDVDDQLNSFLRMTLETLNSVNVDEEALNKSYRLSLKNIEGLWKKYFPPCMLYLNQKLIQLKHLKHDGRRQLWLFFKGCGMDVVDNKEYFTRHFQMRQTASEIKSHMYNIEHAYGLRGHRQDGKPKLCRNIIMG